MEKLETGMYVRTKYGIGKIINKVNDINDYYYGCWVADNDIGSYDNTPFSQFEYLTDNEVLKVSEGIIDLINAGDYVNGYPVLFSGTTKWDIDGNAIEKMVHINRNGYDLWLKEENIEKVITKEQLEKIEYRIGE